MPYEQRTLSNPLRKLVLLAGAAALLLSSSPVLAQARKAKKPKPACGISWLPMTVGTEWTYDYIPPPPPKEGEPERLPLVFPPKQVIIRVKAVTKPKKGKKGPTEIELEETADKLVRKTILKCTTKSLEVSPQSFFFAGEPGGGTNVELSNQHRTGKSFPGAKGFARRGQTHELTLTGDIKRNSKQKIKLDTVSLSVTRTLSYEGEQKVTAPAGEFPRAMRVRLEVSGKVKLKNKETLFPQNVPGAMWFVKGVGVVQSYNTLGQQYRLNATSIKFGKKTK